MDREKQIALIAEHALEAFALLKRISEESDLELDDAGETLDDVALIPMELSDAIDAFNERIYDGVQAIYAENETNA